MITEDLGIKRSSPQIADLGSAKRVIVDKDNTTIVEGAGDAPAIQVVSRRFGDKLRTRLPIMIAKRLQERLTRWRRHAVIRVGASFEDERKDAR